MEKKMEKNRAFHTTLKRGRIGCLRLLCEKVGDHTRMRMAVYWRAALKEHKKAEGVPAAPNLEIPNDAERIYLSGYKEFYKLDDQMK